MSVEEEALRRGAFFLFRESYGLTGSLTMPAAVTTASAESAVAAAKTTIMSLSKAAASAPA